jgi:hypothetical protein
VACVSLTQPSALLGSCLPSSYVLVVSQMVSCTHRFLLAKSVNVISDPTPKLISLRKLPLDKRHHPSDLELEKCDHICLRIATTKGVVLWELITYLEQGIQGSYCFPISQLEKMLEGTCRVIVNKVVPLESEWPNHSAQSIVRPSRVYDET